MTIFTATGFAISRDNTQPNDPVTEVYNDITLRLGVPDGTTTFSYSVISAPAGELAEVDVTTNELFEAINNISIDELINTSTSVDTYIGQVAWGTNKLTQIMLIEIDDGDSSTEVLFRLGGDALPSINTVAAWNAFEGSIGTVGAIPASSPLAAGKAISYNGLPGTSSQTDNPITGTNGRDTLTGTAGNDLIDPEINGGNGDHINGSAGNDYILFTSSQQGDYYHIDYRSLAAPITVDLNADWAHATVDKGAAGTDQLIDFHRAANWTTGDGVSMDGTTGNDVFNIKMDASDNWVGFWGGYGNDTFNITEGEIIRLDYRGATNAIVANLTTGVIQDGLGGTDQVNVDAGATARIEIRGTDNNDSITGSDRNERFILMGGTDNLDAGDGWDSLRYDRSGVGAVTVNLATGLATGIWNGNAFTHNIAGIEEVRGSRNDSDNITGDDNDNWFRGRGGDDTLNGGGGDDTLIGEQGNDVISGGAGTDVAEFWLNRSEATISQSGGNVTVTSALGTDVLSGVETLRFYDQEIHIDTSVATADADTIEGTGGADNLDGLAGDDLMTGLAGNDTLQGGAGDDTLDGGTGNDLLIGGQGSDTIIVDSAGDRVAESRKWAGHDTVISSVDFRMGRKHIEDLELTGTARIGAGNGLMNRITGNDSDNILDGGKNNDTLIGGLGDDTYLIRAPGDSAVEQAGEGIDAVRAYRSYALEAHIEKLFMQNVFTRDGDPTNLNGIGNGLNNTIIGTPFDNTLIGREGNDVLKGQAGDDTFVFDRAIGTGNVDRIIDFETIAGDNDTLKFKASALGGGVAAGVLDAADFATGTAAADASDRFVFDQASGQLWYDIDGTGAAAQVLLATFEQNAAVQADDILVF
ncbi:MAG: calcium-binding protein [Shimia sp.]|nr:calcium-binding protein [Shimia sp.]